MKKTEKEKLYTEIGYRLRKARLEHGYTQERLAEQLGMNTQYYGKVERGLGGLTLLNIKKISEILELDIHYLVTGVCESKLRYDEIIKCCPQDKRYDFEQLIRYALNLTKDNKR